jgi:hypothetical protein
MKSTIKAIAATFVTGILTCNAAVTSLTEFGTTNFTIESSITNVPNSQTATTATITGGEAGGIFAGTLTTPFSLSSTDPIVLVFSFTGTNRNTPFDLQFFDSSFAAIGTYQGTTTAATSASTPTNLALNLTTSAFSNASVGAIQLTLNGAGDSISYTLHSVSVPEPSTYALMALGGLVLFFIARRRKAQA